MLIEGDKMAHKYPGRVVRKRSKLAWRFHIFLSVTITPQYTPNLMTRKSRRFQRHIREILGQILTDIF